MTDQEKADKLKASRIRQIKAMQRKADDAACTDNERIALLAAIKNLMALHSIDSDDVEVFALSEATARLDYDEHSVLAGKWANLLVSGIGDFFYCSVVEGREKEPPYRAAVFLIVGEEADVNLAVPAVMRYFEDAYARVIALHQRACDIWQRLDALKSKPTKTNRRSFLFNGKWYASVLDEGDDNFDMSLFGEEAETLDRLLQVEMRAFPHPPERLTPEWDRIETDWALGFTIRLVDRLRSAEADAEVATVASTAMTHNQLVVKKESVRERKAKAAGEHIAGYDAQPMPSDALKIHNRGLFSEGSIEANQVQIETKS